MNEEKQSLIQRYFQDILSRGNTAAASELLAPVLI
jgi:hypothetical protein